MAKSGRTQEGARAASSHTGAIAGADITVSAFLAQCGVLRANRIDELFDVALALERCPLPPGNRVGILTNAGGPAIMATDACVNLGLEISRLSDDTASSLRSFLPPEASVANPVDMIASARPEDYLKAMRLMLSDPAVDMLLAINVTPLLTRPVDVMAAISEAAGESDGKPVLAVMMATEDFYDEIKESPDRPPVYRFPESAARALAQLSRYGAWRRRPDDETIPQFEVDDDAVAEILDRAGDGYLTSDLALRILDLYGIPTARWQAAPHTHQSWDLHHQAL